MHIFQEGEAGEGWEGDDGKGRGDGKGMMGRGRRRGESEKERGTKKRKEKREGVWGVGEEEGRMPKRQKRKRKGEGGGVDWMVADGAKKATLRFRWLTVHDQNPAAISLYNRRNQTKQHPPPPSLQATAKIPSS